MPDIRFSGILAPPVGSQPNRPSSPSNQSRNGDSFSEILSREMEGGQIGAEGVKFSKHAQIRLQSRNINLEAGDLRRLGDAVEMAASKGVTDSLVMLNNVAYIVSVPEKTVVTAVPVGEADGHVFTNINGAVIL